jgi:hypothetical protein
VSKREAEARRLAGTAPRALARDRRLLLAAWLGYVAYGLDPGTVSPRTPPAVHVLPAAAALLRFRARLRADVTGSDRPSRRDGLSCSPWGPGAVACAIVVGAGLR